MNDRKDIFRQKQCAVCRTFFYEDELQQDDSEQLLCRHCYINSLTAKKGFVSKINIEIAKGMHFLEILLVVAIIGVMVGIMVPSIMKMRKQAADKALMNLYYDNYDTEVGEMAEEFLVSYEQGEALQDIVTDMPEIDVDDISDEEFAELEKELGNCVGTDVEELKLAKAMKALMELQWYEDQLDQLD